MTVHHVYVFPLMKRCCCGTEKMRKPKSEKIGRVEIWTAVEIWKAVAGSLLINERA